MPSHEKTPADYPPEHPGPARTGTYPHGRPRWPDPSGHGFRATADALVTVGLTGDGEIRDVSKPWVQIHPRRLRALICSSCGTGLPDLPAADFYELRNPSR